MKLLVRVIEARNLPEVEPNVLSHPYVELQLGRQKFRSKVLKKCLNTSWCEEFTFKVDDLKDELVISLLDEDKYFNDDSVGQTKVPISQVFKAKDKSLGTDWYTLQPKNKKQKNKNCGEILLTICFTQSDSLLDLPRAGDPAILSRKHADAALDSPRFSQITRMFKKAVDKTTMSSIEISDASDLHEVVNSVDLKNKSEEKPLSVDFEEIMQSFGIKNQGIEVPSNLSKGVVLDQLYGIAPRELNSVIYSPASNLLKSLCDIQSCTDVQIGPWEYEKNGESLKRVVSYFTAGSKFMKGLKTTEEHTYLKADDKAFAVMVSLSIPDAPFGKTFKVEMLNIIMPGPDQPSGEQSSRLVVSWEVNFLQSTMMKGMIEGGASKAIKDSFVHYSKMLSQIVKPLDLKDIGTEKDQLLSSLQVEQQPNRILAVQFFANFTVFSTALMGLYVLVHILLATPSKIQGLEFVGLDILDSIGEVIVCGVLFLQGKRVMELMSRFMQARVRKGSDHRIKAQGDGWLLTVALIGGSNLAAVDSRRFCDPYAVFTCNGKTRTSSIKFQKYDPFWNEIFEFDAMDDPPSVLDVEVFDFDGPFDEATSLGYAEVNFLKSNVSDLSDIWISLHGKLAEACQSKLQLRIFLNNSRGGNVVKDYITKMEKEVGKKIRVRSPRTNSAFQKLFDLPFEEFLINDFACHLKRKMPLQGRLFVSARIIGFHADIFGLKTKFSFLWEDIKDIEFIPPTLLSMGSSIIITTLRPGRGLDARHRAKTQDAEGKLKFHFHSFASFKVAYRTIMALWRAKEELNATRLPTVDEEFEV